MICLLLLAGLLALAGMMAAPSAPRVTLFVALAGLAASLLLLAMASMVGSDVLHTWALFAYGASANLLMGCLLQRGLSPAPPASTENPDSIRPALRFLFAGLAAGALGGSVFLLPEFERLNPGSLGANVMDYELVYVLPLAMLLITSPLFTLLGLVFAVMSLLRGPIVHPRRTADQENCAKCGYLLHGLPEPRCPECGTPFSPSLLDRPANRDTPSWRIGSPRLEDKAPSASRHPVFAREPQRPRPETTSTRHPDSSLPPRNAAAFRCFACPVRVSCHREELVALHHRVDRRRQGPVRGDALRFGCTAMPDQFPLLGFPLLEASPFVFVATLITPAVIVALRGSASRMAIAIVSACLFVTSFFISLAAGELDSYNLLYVGLSLYAATADGLLLWVAVSAFVSPARLRARLGIEWSAPSRIAVLFGLPLILGGGFVLYPFAIDALYPNLFGQSAHSSMVLVVPGCMMLPAAALFSILGFSGLIALALGWRPRHGRLAEPKCARCGYLLHGLPEPRCPECGTPFGPLPTRQPGNATGSQADVAG